MKLSLKLRLYAYELGLNRARRGELLTRGGELAAHFADHRDSEVLARQTVSCCGGSNEVKFLCHVIDDRLRRDYGSPFAARAMIFAGLSSRCDQILHEKAVPAIQSDHPEVTIEPLRADRSEPESTKKLDDPVAIASKACNNVADQVVAHLQEMTDHLPSGESGLANIWEEICVQVQYEQSVVWDEVYDYTVRLVVGTFVDELADEQREAIWRQTERGMEWELDEEPEGEQAPVMDVDVVNYVTETYVYARADQYSNPRVEQYLRRAHGLPDADEFSPPED